jgi:hypothetical protein
MRREGLRILKRRGMRTAEKGRSPFDFQEGGR